MDIVGCSQLPSDEQKRIVERLRELVRESAEFQRAREKNRLLSLPTGDGMALAFFDDIQGALQCAIEITRGIQAESLCRIRMGIHTGPVFVMEDINGKTNISGAGINRAERVMSCGTGGHILLSDTAAESLRHLSQWGNQIHEVGECRVKDGWVRIWNFVDGPIGNPQTPARAKRIIRRRWTVTAVGYAALAATLAFSGAFLARYARPRSGPSVAVLPFSDMSPHKDQQYFADGLAAAVRSALSNTPGLKVPGEMSSLQFRDSKQTLAEIGKALGVANVLAGGVQEQGGRLRVNVELTQVEDGRSLWTDTYDRRPSDVYAVQDQIAQTVAGALKIALLGPKDLNTAEKNPNLEAYNAYLQGHYEFNVATQESLQKAYAYFQRAIQLDPRYAAAWAALGETRLVQKRWFPRMEQAYAEAREAVEHALALNRNLGSAHSVLGEIKVLNDWDWNGGDECYRKALALEPKNARALNGAAELARIRGHVEESIALYRRAIEIEPLDGYSYLNLGIACSYAGKLPEAAAALQRALEVNSETSIAHTYLGRVYLQQSRPREALTEMQKETNAPFRLFGLGLAYFDLRMKKEADDSLAQFVAQYPMDGSYQIAEIYAYRGDTSRALEWLEKTYTMHDAGITEMKGDPLLARLFNDPRYQALLRKVGL